MAIQRRPITPEAAATRIEAMCSRAEYSRLEVTRKLRGWGISETHTERIVRDLVRARFVDDLRFARGYTHDKLEYSRWGVKKIILGLRQKGIDSDIISEAIEEIDPSRYREIAIAIIRAKARVNGDADTYEGRQKLLRFMLSRGFEPSVAVAIIKHPELWAGEQS